MNSALTKARNIFSRFPKDNICYCFCYGSGVFKQAGKNRSRMIDLVFVVDNASNFHEDNLRHRSRHYSALKYLGPNAVTKFQEQWAAKMYYNTLIYDSAEDVTYKYGIISRDDFINDLLDWRYLYISGRLHKPVAVLHDNDDPEFATALRNNVFSAAHAALLTIPEFFSEQYFYETIANISYKGDFRMYLGEDKNKVRNIVLPQMEYFRELYSSVVSSLSDFLYIPEPPLVGWQQDKSPEARWHHLNNLPRVPQKRLVNLHNKLTRARRDSEEALHTMSFDPEIGKSLKNILETIVFSSSVKQSLKGIMTAGIIKSLKYGGRKVYSMFSS